MNLNLLYHIFTSSPAYANYIVDRMILSEDGFDRTDMIDGIDLANYPYDHSYFD